MDEYDKLRCAVKVLISAKERIDTGETDVAKGMITDAIHTINDFLKIDCYGRPNGSPDMDNSWKRSG